MLGAASSVRKRCSVDHAAGAGLSAGHWNEGIAIEHDKFIRADVGGWPDLAPGIPWIDTDADGMPDEWETAHGLDPATADGATDRDGDGYSNLEDWLNSLAD